MMSIDLFIDGPQGLWVLGHALAADIGTVVTHDPNVHEMALTRGVVSHLGPLIDLPHSPAARALSVHYREILPLDFLRRYTAIYNLHPGYLPWGRGYYPVFWAIWEGECAGASLHLMTERVDAGPIVERVLAVQGPHDTGGTLLKEVYELERRLFLKWWPLLLQQEILPTFIPDDAGSYHSKAHFLKLRDAPPIHELSVDAMCRLARALCHPDYQQLTFTKDNLLFEMKVRREDA
jgi:hypothetical protein